MTGVTRVIMVVLACLASCGSALAFHLDDIEYWIGEGANRSGLAIDWDGDDLGLESAPSLAWGYRWDGAATLEDALRAVLSADARLFAKLGSAGGMGAPVFGLGYDLNGDGAFALDDGAQFDADGVAISGPADGAICVDPGDAYREGWATSFWHIATAPGPVAGDWTTAGGGISTSLLAASSWLGFANTPFFDFTAAANNLVAADPPSLPGDYNTDGRVDVADYTVWRDTLGDAVSYGLWRDNYGVGVWPASVSFSSVVPEPESGFLLVICVAMLGVWPTVRASRLTGARRRGDACFLTDAN